MKIVFLDIDGPMIPADIYLVNMNCSWQRQMSERSVRLINTLCEHTGAVIVTNSAHNYFDVGRHDPVLGYSRPYNLRNDLILAGVKAEHFHTDWRTRYPENNDDELRATEFGLRPPRMSELGGNKRYLGVLEWLKRHPEVEQWIGFDDDIYTTDERLIVVDFDEGITFAQARDAFDRLGGTRCGLSRGLMI